MASVEKRPTGKWRARYYDAAGKQHARHFPRKVDAQRWLDEVTASVVTGRYVDPGAGRITFRDYAEEVWRPAQQHRPSTAQLVRGHLERNVYPAFGDRRLDTIQPSDVQALVTAAGKRLSPGTVTVIYRYVSSIFKSAVRDRRLPESPCIEIRLPKAPVRRVEPITTATVEAIIEAVPARYRALVVVAAGTGLRQGELFGLTTDRVDFIARRITVDRQLSTVNGRAPVFGPVKTDASNRRVPLPLVVGDALLEHVARFEPGQGGLIFTNVYGEPLRRSGFNQMWAKALASAGISRTVFHSLRHYYASLLIRHGESVKAVQERLGHASATETLDTYSHLWPDSDDRTREAVDAVLGLAALAAREDSSRTPGVSR